MGEYGIVLAKTATMNADGQQMTGSTGAEQMAIRWVDKVRFDLFKKWYIDNHNPKEEVTMRCVAHVANLIGADILANNQVGNKVLVVSFFLRIGADKIFGENWIPGESVLSSIALQPISMYDNATHLLKTIDLQFP